MEEIYAKVMDNFTENKCSEGLFLQVNKFKPTKNNNRETNINCSSQDKDLGLKLMNISFEF